MNKKILLIGDSLTAGMKPLGVGMIERKGIWPALLADLLAHQYQPNTIDIFLDAIPGRMIQKPLLELGLPNDIAMGNIHKIYQKHHDFDLLVVLLGSNDYFALDAFVQQTGEEINIPKKVAIALNQFLTGLKNSFIDNDEEVNYKTLVLIPPIANTIDGEMLTDLPDVFKDVIGKKGYELLDLQKIVAPHKEDQKIYDGIHFSEDQQSTIAKNVAKDIIDKNLLNF